MLRQALLGNNGRTTNTIRRRVMKRPWLCPALLAAVLHLAGCGGGGDGGAASAPPPPSGSAACVPSAPAPVPAAPPPAGQVYVTGVAQAQIVPDNLTTGALDYGGIACQPIPAAVVEVQSSTGAVLATTTTDAGGNFAAAVPANTAAFVRVKAQMLQSGAGVPNWNVAVRDNTQGNSLYALDSAVFNIGASNVVQNLSAGSGWNGSSYAGTRASGPFALLRTVYGAMQKVASVQPTVSFPPLTLYWSINNVPSGGNPSQGQIGTTFFTQDAGGGRAIFVLGGADVDTDEFDETVIAHEFGHYLQNAFSRDDSIGGRHGGGDLLDMRVAFSEGWGNGWSGIATGRRYYTDSNGASQGRGFVIDLAQPVSVQPGWYREDSVQYLFYSFNQRFGFTPVWQAMTAGAFRSGTAVTSIHAYAAALKAISPSNAAAINSLLGSQSITVNDAFGTGETNDAGLGTGNVGNPYRPLPLYKSYNGASGTFCLNFANDPQGEGNKLGGSQFLRFTAAAGTRTVTVAGGRDPDFELYQNGFLAQGGSDANGIESRSVRFAAGDAVLVFHEFDPKGAGGGTACYNVTIN